MDLYSLLEALRPAQEYAAQPAASLKKRVVPLLASLAEPEYEEASRQLQQIKETDWESRVRAASRSLESAYGTFYRQADEMGLRGFLRQLRRFCSEYVLFGFGGAPRRLDGYRKAMEAGLLIAVCQRALNDPPAIAEWVGRSVRCFDRYARINVAQKPVEPQVTLDGVRYEHKLERELRQQKWQEHRALLRFGSELTGVPLEEEEELPV
jgi:hypothetical protein